MVTAILTAAGLATRLLPWTYSIPKEMLPIPYNGRIVPIIQIVFEKLYRLGIRKFVVVIRRGKNIIVDHFSPDPEFILKLLNLKKTEEAGMLMNFYKMTLDSAISFVPAEPNGFGGAVLAAEKYVDDKVLIVAPDMLLDINDIPIRNTLFIGRSNTPQKYGVVNLENDRVIGIEEKPVEPKSNYIFLGWALLDTQIFKYLHEVSNTTPRYEEIQLTDAIRLMLKDTPIYASIIDSYHDVGNFEDYSNFFVENIGNSK